MCIYYFTIYIHICTHISYVLYRPISCLNLSILLYIVGICNICQWHVTILGSPVAPRWFRGDPGPMVTHQYGSWRRVAWRSQNGWRETGPTVGMADGWLNSFFLVRYAEHFGFILQLLHVQTFQKKCIRKSSKMTRPSWFCRLWCSWSMQFRNRCAPYGPYIVSKVLYKLSFIRTLEWC